MEEQNRKAAWEANVRPVTPYVPGEQPKRTNLIKLNTNENPYPPAPAVRRAMAGMDMQRFRLYPDPQAGVLVEALSDRYGVKKEQVFVGVGSDDVLSMAFLTFFNGGKPILFPNITYSFYDVWAKVYQIPFTPIPLNAEFEIEPQDYVKAAGTTGGIVFPNPNAPTGVELPLAQVEEIVRANADVVVIVDEAYIDFGGQSALPLVSEYENLLVVQTFSKSRSMAGVRIGFAIGSEKLIAYLNSVKESVNSYTMNLPSLELGVAALSDETYFQEICHKIIQTRERVTGELQELGFTVLPSKANFVFAKPPKLSAEELFQKLRAANIFVRYFNRPIVNEYLRITIGTDEEMDTLLAFLKQNQ